MPIGKGNVLTGKGSLESIGQQFSAGNNFYISINTESKEDTDDTFAKFSEGGKINVPKKDMFCGDYFGMFKEKFDIQWMVSFHKAA